jgi:hypothetical protein
MPSRRSFGKISVIREWKAGNKRLSISRKNYSIGGIYRPLAECAFRA